MEVGRQPPGHSRSSVQQQLAGPRYIARLLIGCELVSETPRSCIGALHANESAAWWEVPPWAVRQCACHIHYWCNTTTLGIAG